MIDDINLNIPGDEPAEWIYVNGIEGTDYTIEGLTTGVTYEVQVQAVNDNQEASEWTESVLFTTINKTDAPGSQKDNFVYNDGNLYYNAYTITLTETEPSVIYYRIGIMTDGQFVYGDWMEYTAPITVTDEGTYMIEAYAVADGKTESDHIWDGFTVSKLVGVDELMAGKTVAGVRYFNLMGQEMAQPSGMTIQVTTYTDGTTSAVKVVK